MPGAPPPSEPRTSPEALDCLLSVHSIIHHARKFAAGLAARKEPPACFALRSAAFGSLLRALRSLSLLARARAGPHRHALAVHCGRAGVQRRVAACMSCAVHGAMLCNVVQMWLVWCRACTHDGRTVLARIVPRVCTRERAEDRLLRGVWCVFVLWLVLCAIVGTQHFNLHICVHAAARAW